MGKPKKISEPHKELRFTRSRQALTFATLAVLLVCVATLLWIKATPMLGNAAGEGPALGSYLWGLIPLLPALWFFWIAAHCARHAFIILTPLGVELFPFWFPSKNMQVVYWSEIDSARVSEDLRTLTIDRKGGGGVVVGLAPVAQAQRPLLKRALEGRLNNG